MKKDILIKYRDKDQELDLLGALEQRGLNQYDDEYKKLIEILLNMLSITKKNSVPIQQYLFRSIYNVLDSILSSKESTEEFTQIIAENVDENNDNVTSFVFRFILNIKDNVEGSGDKRGVEALKAALERINIEALHAGITNNKDYSLIVKLFYNCVTDMESDRRVILHAEAIEKFHSYIIDNPAEYLQNFLRPYYNGPRKDHLEFYLHVGDPFWPQIFQKDSVLQYLNNIDNTIVDSKLIQDIREYYERVKTKPRNEDKIVILYSSEYPWSNEVHLLKILSKEHKHVRPLCLPPDYKDSKK
ncbi:hypothetical protein [Sphingobacterium kitahiroshimense]|uniref:Uncharacterized protein n=1 Tax=Sphingobacterium kitahiroshimense TaxID=470446 RepID=A0ABV0BZ53_9SPHI